MLIFKSREGYTPNYSRDHLIGKKGGRILKRALTLSLFLKFLFTKLYITGGKIPTFKTKKISK